MNNFPETAGQHQAVITVQDGRILQIRLADFINMTFLSCDFYTFVRPESCAANTFGTGANVFLRTITVRSYANTMK